MQNLLKSKLTTRYDSIMKTSGSAIAEGPRNALVSRNSATTKLENESPGPIVWHYLRDPTFSRFHATPECDRHTHADRQTDGQIQHCVAR